MDLHTAVVVAKGGEVSVKAMKKPKPKADEALVRVSRSGICNTDLEIVKGYSKCRVCQRRV